MRVLAVSLSPQSLCWHFGDKHHLSWRCGHPCCKMLVVLKITTETHSRNRSRGVAGQKSVSKGHLFLEDELIHLQKSVIAKKTFNYSRANRITFWWVLWSLARNSTVVDWFNEWSLWVVWDEFDHWYWESDVDSDSVKTIKKVFPKVIGTKSEGAIGMDLAMKT